MLTQDHAGRGGTVGCMTLPLLDEFTLEFYTEDFASCVNVVSDMKAQSYFTGTTVAPMTNDYNSTP